MPSAATIAKLDKRAAELETIREGIRVRLAESVLEQLYGYDNHTQFRIHDIGVLSDIFRELQNRAKEEFV